MWEIHLIDVLPERLKPCMGNASEINAGYQGTVCRRHMVLQHLAVVDRILVPYMCWIHSESNAIYLWLALRDVRTQHKVDAGCLFLRSNPTEEGCIQHYIGGIGAEMGVSNREDSGLLRNRPSAMASDNKHGFVALRDWWQLWQHATKLHKYPV